MDEIAALDKIDSILAEVPSSGDASYASTTEEGYRLTGALVIGQFVGPDGRSTAMTPCALGNMNAWAQEGIHAWALRRIAAGDHSIVDE
jgi:hypothetical protein